jgi:phospholipid/cholesterol/gamma-HCH transport system substrate-binding protein
MAEELSLHRSPFEWRQARVALTIIVGTLFLLYGAYRIGEVLDVFAKRYQLVTFAPSVLGLREGAPVTLAGQQIGQVKKIEFIPINQKRGANNLRIEIAISDDVKDQIRRDSKAYFRTQGLLGDKFVDIEPGSVHAAILQKGDTLQMGKSVDMDMFLTQASDMMDQTMTIVGDVRSLTRGLASGKGTIGRFLNDDQLYAHMVSATAGLQTTLSTINNSDGTFGRMLRDPAMYQRMTSVAGRLDSVGSIILYGNGSMSKLLRSDSLYRNLASATSRADSMMITMSAMLEKMANGNGTIQKMMTDPALYDAFLKAVTDMQSLINDVRLEPGKYKPNIDVHVFGGGSKPAPAPGPVRRDTTR